MSQREVLRSGTGGHFVHVLRKPDVPSLSTRGVPPMKPSHESRREANLRSVDAVAVGAQSGERIDYGFAMVGPDAFDAAFAARRDELRDVTIRCSPSCSAAYSGVFRCSRWPAWGWW